MFMQIKWFYTHNYTYVFYIMTGAGRNALFAPVASPFRFTIMGEPQKDMIDSAIVTVTICFSSLTVTRPVNRELKTRLLKWLSKVPEFAIRPIR